MIAELDLRFPRPAGDQWLHVPHPPLEQPAQPPPCDPTNPRSPLKAKVENWRVTRPLSHCGQRTRVRAGGDALLEGVCTLLTNIFVDRHGRSSSAIDRVGRRYSPPRWT